ncbi:putative protein FAM47D [Phyllostomus hastatus]|uniref:putative protein FAM47D n=1 Tax=Phyllostomus hastatus TaxID=9423 RepID=UPI001E683354|nr:putative protein FAM47D [Phyllostomus hastatus]
MADKKRLFQPQLKEKWLFGMQPLEPVPVGPHCKRWYKTRNKVPPNSLAKHRHRPLKYSMDSRWWISMREGLDDFRTGLPPANNLFIRGHREGFLSTTAHRVPQPPPRKTQKNLPKGAELLSRLSPAQKARKAFVEELKDSLAPHPLTRYPDLKKILSADLLLKVLEETRPDKKLEDTWVCCEDMKDRKKSPTKLGEKHLEEVNPEPSEPSQPGTSRTSQPGTSQPSQPGTSQPSQPGTSQPSQPGTSQPSQPGTSQPIQPGTSQPSQPGISQPSQPGTSQPSQPGTSQPSQPGTSQPIQPGTSQPSQPGTSQPIQPGTSQPSQPGTSQPSQPGPPNQVNLGLPSQVNRDLPSKSTWDFPANSTGDLLANSTGDLLNNSTGHLLANSTGDHLAKLTRDLPSKSTRDLPAKLTWEQLVKSSWDLLAKSKRNSQPSQPVPTCQVNRGPPKQVNRRPPKQVNRRPPKQVNRGPPKQVTPELPDRVNQGPPNQLNHVFPGQVARRRTSQVTPGAPDQVNEGPPKDSFLSYLMKLLPEEKKKKKSSRKGIPQNPDPYRCVGDEASEFSTWTDTFEDMDFDEKFIMERSEFDEKCMPNDNMGKIKKVTQIPMELYFSKELDDIEKREFALQEGDWEREFRKPPAPYRPNWVKLRYGDWYLNPKTSEKQINDEPWVGSKLLEEQKYQSHARDLEPDILDDLYGPIAFKDFIVSKGYRMPGVIEKLFLRKKWSYDSVKTPIDRVMKLLSKVPDDTSEDD